MVRSGTPRRGDVWVVELEPTIGREIQKARPCLVVSPDSMNRFLRTYTVVPLTSGSRPAPFRAATNFRGKDGLLLSEQMRTVDRSRMTGLLGQVDRATLLTLLAILREMFEE